jgi:hypothetical protein
MVCCSFQKNGLIRHSFYHKLFISLFLIVISSLSVQLAQSTPFQGFTIDTTPPQAGLISINNDAPYTKSTTVTIKWSGASDSFIQEETSYDVASTGISNSHNGPYTWSAYSTVSRLWNLTLTEGIKTVYAVFKDLAGNISKETTDTIILDTSSPSSNAGTIIPNYQTSIPFQVPYFAADAGSGLSLVQLYYASQPLIGGSWSAYAMCDSQIVSGKNVNGSFMFTAPAGSKKYAFITRAMDMAGNWDSSPITPDATAIYDASINTRLLPDVKLLKNKSQSQLFDLDKYTAALGWQALYTGNLGNVAITINGSTHVVDYLTPLSAVYGEDTITYVANGSIGYPSIVKYSTYLLQRLPDVLVDNGWKLANTDIDLKNYVIKDIASGYPISYAYQTRYGNPADTGKLNITFSGSSIRVSASGALSAPAQVVVTATPGTAADWDKGIIHVYEVMNSYGQFSVAKDTTKWYFERYNDGIAAGTLSWVASYIGQSGVIKITQKPGEKAKFSQLFTVASTGWYTAKMKIATDVVDIAKQQKVYLYVYEYTKDMQIISSANQIIALGSGGFGNAGKWKDVTISYFATGTILSVQAVGINPVTSQITSNLYLDNVWVYPAPPQVEQCYGATEVPIVNSSFDSNTIGWFVEVYADGNGTGTWNVINSWSNHNQVLRGTQAGGQKAQISQLFQFPDATNNAAASVWVYSGATNKNNSQKVYFYLYSYDSGYSQIIESGNGILYPGQWAPNSWREIKFGYMPISNNNAVELIAINPIGQPTQILYFDDVKVKQDQDSPYYWDHTLY